MQRTKEITLDDVAYITTQYSASKGLKILTKIAKIVGKPIAMLASAGGMQADLTPDLVGIAVDSIVEHLNENEVEAFSKEIISTTQIKSENGWRQIEFNTDFAGRYGHLFRLMKGVLTFQYNDFLPDLVAATDQLAASKEVTVKTQPVSRIKAR